MKEILKNRLKEREKNSNFILKPTFPKKNLLIELSNMCNNQCLFCANRKMTRKRGSMDFELLKKILTECYNLGTREVGFYTTGEPLVYKAIYDAIKLAKDIGYDYVYITTNGLLCTKDNFVKLVNHGLDSIKFSINAINKKAYKLIHNTDTFDIVFQNLKDAYRYKAENNLKINIFVSYIATKYTNYPSQEIKDFFKDYADEVLVVNVRNQSGLTPENITFLSVNDDDKFEAERHLPCHYVFNTINVTYEGYLTACCTDFQNYLVYGDINNNSIKECWHNRIITSLRKQHLNKKLESNLCKNCIYNSLEVPKPLIKKFATVFDSEMFSFSQVEQRIKNYSEES